MWLLRIRRLLKATGAGIPVLLKALVRSGTPAWIRLATLGLIIYVFSPVDLLPDFALPFGLADDLTLIALLVPWLVARLPAQGRGPSPSLH
ncbi:MAG: YkvA family protein [Burkholderiaceae bacterium]